MIVKNYDIGWGAKWPMKYLEQEMLERVLSKFRKDNSRTVVINSVWYSNDYHQQVIQELRKLQPSHVIVVAMLDPPIVNLDWFKELNCEVIGIGYYSSSDVDYFAEFMNKFFQVPQFNLLDSSAIDTAYMCLNRKPHPHRLRLYQGLKNAGVLDCGFVSMGGNPPERIFVDDVAGQEFAPNGGSEQFGINNDIASLGNIDRWRRHLLNIVTETTWDIESCNFLSEKTYKPILGLRPFLIYAPNGGIECLQRRGFEHYLNDFNDISDVDLREPHNVPEFLKILCNQPVSYYKMKLTSLKEKLMFNRNKFDEYVSEQRRIL